MKKIKNLLPISMIYFLIISASIYASEFQPKSNMRIKNLTLWQLIEKLIDHPSFTLDTIGQVLPVDFSERHRTHSFSSYVGGYLQLVDQIIVGPIEIRIRHKDGIGRLLRMGTSGACVMPDEVYAHYPDLIPIPPRGHMLVDATFYNVKRTWGVLTFGFADSDQECLASVVLDRINPISAPTNQY